MPEGLIPPRRDRAGVSRLIRSVPCSMRCTGRPRPIPGGGFTRWQTRFYRRDVLQRAWVMVRANNGAPGIDRTTLAQAEQYGIDRLLGELASELREGRYRPLPARRVLIPKPGSPEGAQRPLSIPVVRDRIVQSAVKIVLEPVFEADMLPCSFGFRPRRSVHDALQVLIDECWRGCRWVVETDIANCFSAIPHQKLMQAVQERVCDQGVLRLLRVMLRAGVLEDGRVRRPVTGSPHGGPVSPLLCNVWFAPASLEAAMSANCLRVYQKPVPYNGFSHTLPEAYPRSMSEAVPRYTTAPSPSWQSSHHRLPASPS